jgi:ribosome-associated heat shock protein Hsp15
MSADGSAAGRPESMRLDAWLDVACLFRTRSEAQKACALGRVTVNGQRAKPHRPLLVGSALEIARPHGRTQQILVLGLAAGHLRKAEARRLYEDRTPAPTPEEIALRRFERLARAAAHAAAAPDKRQRRALRALKGKG